MDVKEEVSSTSSPCEEPVEIEAAKKPVDIIPLPSAEHESELAPPSPPKSAKVNGDLSVDVPVSPKPDDVVSISSTAIQLNDADSSVTSPEPSEDPKLFKESDESSNKSEDTDSSVPIHESQPLAISSPTISATISPKDQAVTCTKSDKTEVSLESFHVSSRSDVSRKEALSLVEKLAMNSSITVSRKESKPVEREKTKSPEVPEGRVLRLRPIPKVEPPKPAPRLPSKSIERKASISSNSSNDKTVKVSKNQKRKHEETDGDLEKSHSSPIQYKGFKSIAHVKEPVKKSIIKFNPFNPAFRRECSRPPSQSCSNFDPSSLQPEYAQYLGLQPLVKFRCSNCGMSSFQTMNALNAHKAECTKSGSLPESNVKSSPTTGLLEATQSEPKSANIKLTRKVFLCSACGTYYELWNLFLHMREAHRRYICLQCLGMSSSPEKLSEHLKQKHGVVTQTFENPEQFSPSTMSQAFYLMCVNCDKIYSETDKFSSHKCQGKKSEDSSSKSSVVSSQTQTADVAAGNDVPAKQSTRRTRESLRKTSKMSKKEDVPPPVAANDDAVEEAKEALKIDELKVDSVVDSAEPVGCSVNVPEEEAVACAAEPPEDAAASAVEEAPAAEIEEEVKVEPEETVAEVDAPEVKEEMTAVVEGLDADANPVVPPLSLSNVISTEKAKNKRKFGKKPARRKRPLTMKPRSKKPKRPPQVPLMPVTTTGLLPNPLNSIDYSPNEGIDPPAVDLPPPVAAGAEPPKSADNSSSHDFLNKLSLPPNIFKLKLNPALDYEGDSDDSQKLSLVVDESANNSDAESKKDNDVSSSKTEETKNEIVLAGDDIQPMALALEDKIENIPIQAVLKECVRTSCFSCNYCRHAHKIAVNGKHLALHLLSEHRYMPTKNEDPDDLINKLKSSLDILENMCFNTETYDNTDPTIHVSYDQDMTFDCFQCNFACGSHKDLFAHKRKLHSKPLLLCIMCKTNFFSYSEMLCHLCPGHYKAEIMFHNLNINYRCCFCRLDSIPSAFRLMVHLRKSHHTCDICLEGCSDQQKLSTHLWKHKVNHLCYRCGISYASKPDITKHLFWKHGHESVLCKKCLQKKWPHVYHFCIPPTSFICEECSASFSKAVALKVHKRMHASEYPYSCSECEKKFISKKLLQRHEDRHKNIESNQNGIEAPADDDVKDEIINVTDVVDVKQENDEDAEKKERQEVKEKSHKKHKKDKKDKVVDLYDLPPLNLSSDSDSSDDGESSKKADDDDKNDQSNGSVEPIADDGGEKPEGVDDGKPDAAVGGEPVDVAGDAFAEADKIDDSSKMEMERQVEGIWENFYKTNPTNHNLPYPLCAMKSEVAYGIIMGDHDYCRQVKTDPVIKDDLPTQSNLESGFDERVDDVDKAEPTVQTDERRKGKSPKKKLKAPNDSSSSSDSSSDSDSSSCTCGTNCSCSSSSSNSSSSSSSESDSSGDEKTKERRKKRKEKKKKNEQPNEVVKEERAVEEEAPRVPVDPPIRESELETDESSTDEEFYDKQPGRIANQIIAEKRNQLIQSVAPPANESEVGSLPQPEVAPTPPAKAKAKDRKRRRPAPKPKTPLVALQPAEPLSQPPPVNQFLPQYNAAPTTPNFSGYDSPLGGAYSTPPPLPTPDGSSSAASDDKSRSSKRRRIPNKFYGYSSGEEDEKPVFKWKKQESTPVAVRAVATPPPPPLPPTPAPSTPRIQLTVPRQVIRKPSYHKVQKTPKITIAPPPPPPPPSLPPPATLPTPPPPPPDSSETDSDADVRAPPYAPSHPPLSEPSSSGKPEKDVYCYCRCPYDEVSEMIACDDETCPIEWFHFECVGILVPPRGQWFCPGCRKARGLPT